MYLIELFNTAKKPAALMMALYREACKAKTMYDEVPSLKSLIEIVVKYLPRDKGLILVLSFRSFLMTGQPAFPGYQAFLKKYNPSLHRPFYGVEYAIASVGWLVYQNAWIVRPGYFAAMLLTPLFKAYWDCYVLQIPALNEIVRLALADQNSLHGEPAPVPCKVPLSAQDIALTQALSPDDIPLDKVAARYHHLFPIQNNRIKIDLRAVVCAAFSATPQHIEPCFGEHLSCQACELPLQSGELLRVTDGELGCYTKNGKPVNIELIIEKLNITLLNDLFDAKKSNLLDAYIVVCGFIQAIQRKVIEEASGLSESKFDVILEKLDYIARFFVQQYFPRLLKKIDACKQFVLCEKKRAYPKARRADHFKDHRDAWFQLTYFGSFVFDWRYHRIYDNGCLVNDSITCRKALFSAVKSDVSLPCSVFEMGVLSGDFFQGLNEAQSVDYLQTFKHDEKFRKILEAYVATLQFGELSNAQSEALQQFFSEYKASKAQMTLDTYTVLLKNGLCKLVNRNVSLCIDGRLFFITPDQKRITYIDLRQNFRQHLHCLLEAMRDCAVSDTLKSFIQRKLTCDDNISGLDVSDCEFILREKLPPELEKKVFCRIEFLLNSRVIRDSRQVEALLQLDWPESQSALRKKLRAFVLEEKRKQRDIVGIVQYAQPADKLHVSDEFIFDEREEVLIRKVDRKSIDSWQKLVDDIAVLQTSGIQLTQAFFDSLSGDINPQANATLLGNIDSDHINYRGIYEQFKDDLLRLLAHRCFTSSFDPAAMRDLKRFKRRYFEEDAFSGAKRAQNMGLLRQVHGKLFITFDGKIIYNKQKVASPANVEDIASILHDLSKSSETGLKQHVLKCVFEMLNAVKPIDLLALLYHCCDLSAEIKSPINVRLFCLFKEYVQTLKLSAERIAFLRRISTYQLFLKGGLLRRFFTGAREPGNADIDFQTTEKELDDIKALANNFGLFVSRKYPIVQHKGLRIDIASPSQDMFDFPINQLKMPINVLIAALSNDDCPEGMDIVCALDEHALDALRCNAATLPANQAMVLRPETLVSLCFNLVKYRVNEGVNLSNAILDFLNVYFQLLNPEAFDSTYLKGRLTALYSGVDFSTGSSGKEKENAIAEAIRDTGLLHVMTTFSNSHLSIEAIVSFLGHLRLPLGGARRPPPTYGKDVVGASSNSGTVAPLREHASPGVGM